jgi:tape measure domain-containing protein
VTVARELVTLIRYETDLSGVRDIPNKVVPGLDKVAPAVDRGNTALARMGMLFRGLLAGVGIAAITRMADDWAGVEGRVKLVTKGVDEQKQALTGLYDIAQATGQAYTATAGLFQSVQRNAKELGLQLDETLQLTDTIGRALTIGGGSASSQEAALTQLGQALGSGKLQGEELNSILEQAPRLAQAIAEAFNIPVGKLKDMAKEGKLTSKELARGLLKQSGKLRDEFESMPLTFSRAFTRLGNALGKQIDKLNKSSGAARIFYRVTSLVIDNLETIIKYVAFLGAAAGLTKLVTMARRAGGLFGAINARLAAMGGAAALRPLLATFLRALAVVTAIYYVFDDISVWFKGGDSLIGDVLGPMSDWKWLADAVVTALTFVKNLLGGAAQTLTQWVSKWGLILVIVGGIVAAIGLIPTIVVALIVAFAGFFNYLRKNWDAIKAMVAGVGKSMSDSVNQAWEDIKAGAIRVWGEISKIISDSIPDFVKSGVKWQGQVIGEGWGNLRSLGEMAGVLPTRPGAVAGGGTTVQQNANVTVNATTNTPAAVADAARRGTQQAMGSSMVPMVEAGP